MSWEEEIPLDEIPMVIVTVKLYHVAGKWLLDQKTDFTLAEATFL